MAKWEIMSRNRLQRTLCLLAIITGVFLSSALDANAATLNVPHDYPTIQAGIDAAQDGDTVLVAPGTYVECLSIQSKWTITVASSAGPEATIIDADGKGAAFIIRDCACTLQGFTMKNGLGPGADAIIISDSWPKIRGNIFAANMLAGGTRIAILVYGISEPWIERNIFLNPGSIWITSSTSLTITNNLFLNNSGAAIEFIGGNCSYEVTNNTIVGNNVGISVYYPFTGSSPICKNNIFVGNNTAFEVTTSPAGSVTGHITSQNNLLYGNTVNYSGVSDQTGINGNISADPLFWAPAVNNFHLRSGSPAIGAADTSSIYLSATDLGGYPRAVNGRLDIGAYEFNPKENYILYTMTASAAAGGAI
ncbi:MAG: right-handed parallel beta-helix repeat-containing protein, partial [Syntrophobacteraceae bacterium]